MHDLKTSDGRVISAAAQANGSFYIMNYNSSSRSGQNSEAISSTQARPSGRRTALRPRSSEQYVNSKHFRGQDDCGFTGKSNRVEGLESLYQQLYLHQRPVNGTWIPNWLVRVCRSEARARVMAEIFWWFEFAFSDIRRRERIPVANVETVFRARARVYDQDGLQWLVMSIRELASRTMLSESTVADTLRWAEKKGLLVIERNGNAPLRIRLNGKANARAFYDATGNEIARDEFLDGNELRSEWTASQTQAEAFHNSDGVTVHNAFVVMLGGDHFAARLLSQILFRFIDRRGNCAAIYMIGGHRWWETTHRRLANELGVNDKRVQRGLQDLLQRGLICKHIEESNWKNRGRQRWVTFLRPNVRQILKEVIEVNEHETLLTKENTDEATE
jgi:DNA-binding transcriptional regulator YhcF (GntR family)